MAALARESVQTVAGTPWTLTSALGVLSSEPVWFNPIGDELCRDVPGASAWNASRMPLASGQFSSGVVPFWSLIYINESRFLMVAVSMNDTVHLAGPISPTTACGSFIGQVVGNFSANPSLDSPAASAYAWSIVGSSYVASNPNAFEFYETGGGQLQFWGSTVGGWIVGYQLCGLPGYAGMTSTLTDEVKFQNTTGMYSLIRSVGGCTQAGYNVTYGTTTNASGSGSTVVTTIPLSLGFANSTNTTDGWGLTSGSTQVSIVNWSTAQPFPPSALSCSVTNLTLAACGPVAGWYAVLATSTGFWLDAYGNISGTPGWLLPNVPFYSGDSLLIVHQGFPSSEAFKLAIVSVTSAVQVSGSTTI